MAEKLSDKLKGLFKRADTYLGKAIERKPKSSTGMGPSQTQYKMFKAGQKTKNLMKGLSLTKKLDKPASASKALITASAAKKARTIGKLKTIGRVASRAALPVAAGFEAANLAYKVATLSPEKKAKIKKLKTSKNGSDVQIGKPAANSVLTGGLSTHTTVTGGVSLYMPPGIKATYSAATGHSELGKAGMIAGSISRMMASKSTAGAIEEALKGLGGFALTAARDLAVGVGETMGLGDIDGAISKVTATAQNNFSEAIFRKMTEREFSYTFKLIARNMNEAQDINKIVKFFKFHMHPELDMANAGRYFRVPSEFEIHYAYNDQKNNYLHELSRCVCKSVDVEYGSGDFQTFRQFDKEGAAPVEVSLTLGFTETTILTKQQIADNF